MATKGEPRKAGAPRRPTGEQRKGPGKSNVRAEMPDEELRRLIAETAYYKAEQRGFSPGYEHEDWVAAEEEVLRRLGRRE